MILPSVESTEEPEEWDRIGKDAGDGGFGAILSGTSGGTLTLEKGSLIQGGNGGNAMVNNAGTTGKGGKGGSAISDVTSGSNTNKVKLNNQGNLPPSTIDWNNIPLDVTLLPGKPGIGYVYTPYVIPDDGTPHGKAGKHHLRRHFHGPHLGLRHRH